jgi:hypothetical protein
MKTFSKRELTFLSFLLFYLQTKSVSSTTMKMKKEEERRASEKVLQKSALKKFFLSLPTNTRYFPEIKKRIP